MENSFRNLRNCVNDENYQGFCKKKRKFISAKEMKEFCLNVAGRIMCNNLKLKIKP